MSLPGSFNITDFMARYGGVPEQYQIDGYLGQVGASTGQRSGLASHNAAQHGGHIPIDKIRDWLTSH